MEHTITFSVSFEALEPHDVFERPRHGRSHRRGDDGSALLQRLPVEARVGSVWLTEISGLYNVY